MICQNKRWTLNSFSPPIWFPRPVRQEVDNQLIRSSFMCIMQIFIILVQTIYKHPTIPHYTELKMEWEWGSTGERPECHHLCCLLLQQLPSTYNVWIIEDNLELVTLVEKSLIMSDTVSQPGWQSLSLHCSCVMHYITLGWLMSSRQRSKIRGWLHPSLHKSWGAGSLAFNAGLCLNTSLA